LITSRTVKSNREVSIQIIVAVSGISSTVHASKDNVCGKRVASTVGSVGDSWAREDSSCRVIDNLSTGDGCQGGEEDS
jgi:hypothetical protein